MRNYEGIFEVMNAVVFYSNTGQSKAVAEFFSKQLEYPLAEIEKAHYDRYQNLVLVFPVHCQNVPTIVNAFLQKITVEYLTVVATYGKMCCGNVLYEIWQKRPTSIVAGAYVPAKHAYIDGDDEFCDFDKLMPMIEKIKNPSAIKLPKLYKNPMSNLFPGLRSRLALGIYKNSNCNNCGVCTTHCSLGAIHSGVTDNKCIRCLRCVEKCPSHALKIKMRWPLRLYLCKKKVSEVIVYV